MAAQAMEGIQKKKFGELEKGKQENIDTCCICLGEF